MKHLPIFFNPHRVDTVIPFERYSIIIYRVVMFNLNVVYTVSVSLRAILPDRNYQLIILIRFLCSGHILCLYF